MISIKFNPQQLAEPLKSEWLQWQQKAESATNRVIEAWEDWRAGGSLGKFEYKFEKDIWTDLKDWLLKNIFHNKCAYCETREVRAPYHAEHFRPKAGVSLLVTTNPKKRRFIKARVQDEEGEDVEHPGYFWLAYHWQNLLPACHDCNAARGKNGQFPVAGMHVAVKRLDATDVADLRGQFTASLRRPDVYYLHPESLNDFEQRILLHPYLDEPAQHLIFGDQGIITACKNSAMGEISMKVYDLEAEPLRIARQAECEKARRIYGDAFLNSSAPYRVRIHVARTTIQDYLDGKLPYSAAVVAHLRQNFPDHGI